MNVAQGESGISQLVERARGGDTHAMNAVLKQTSRQLLKLTRLMFQSYPNVKRWEATDDVFQLAMIRVSKEIAAVSPASTKAFKGFVALQIRRTLIDLARKHSRRAAYQDVPSATNMSGGCAQLVGVKECSTRPETMLEWTRFHESIETMPIAEQEVFSLKWYAGLTHQEIATSLEVSIPTVKRRWLRARCFIFDAMGGHSPNEVTA